MRVLTYVHRMLFLVICIFSLGTESIPDGQFEGSTESMLGESKNI